MRGIYVFCVALLFVSCATQRPVKDAYLKGYLKGKETGYKEGYKEGYKKGNGDCKDFFFKVK